VLAIIETAIKKIYHTDVAAVIEEVQLQCFKAKTKETSSAADPATVFDRVNRFPSHPQIISDRLSPFANKCASVRTQFARSSPYSQIICDFTLPELYWHGMLRGRA